MRTARRHAKHGGWVMSAFKTLPWRFSSGQQIPCNVVNKTVSAAQPVSATNFLKFVFVWRINEFCCRSHNATGTRLCYSLYGTVQR